jgi:hypothetical protein
MGVCPGFIYAEGELLARFRLRGFLMCISCIYHARGWCIGPVWCILYFLLRFCPAFRWLLNSPYRYKAVSGSRQSHWLLKDRPLSLCNINRVCWLESGSEWPRKRHGFGPFLCLSWDVAGRWTVWSASPYMPVVCHVSVSSLRSAAFSRSYLRDDCFDTDSLVGDRAEFSIATGAVVCCGLGGDVPGGISSFVCEFTCRGGGWEIRPVLAWDVCLCKDEPRGLDLIVLCPSRLLLSV